MNHILTFIALVSSQILVNVSTCGNMSEKVNNGDFKIVSNPKPHQSVKIFLKINAYFIVIISVIKSLANKLIPTNLLLVGLNHVLTVSFIVSRQCFMMYKAMAFKIYYSGLPFTPDHTIKKIRCFLAIPKPYQSLINQEMFGFNIFDNCRTTTKASGGKVIGWLDSLCLLAFM